MISIHQFHYRASAGEAVTQHMLFIREALAEAGIGGKIFSVQRKIFLKEKFKRGHRTQLGTAIFSSSIIRNTILT